MEREKRERGEGRKGKKWYARIYHRNTCQVYVCVCVCGCARADRRYAYTVRSRVWCVFAWVAACEQNFSKTIPGPGRESIFGRWCGVKRGMGMGMAVAGWRGI